MRYSDFAVIKENASSGGSSSASVATANTPFFSSDPKETAARSIYAQATPTKKTKKKPVVVRR